MANLQPKNLSEPELKSQARLCLLPKYTGGGGPASFQGRLAAGLAARGVEVTYSADDLPVAAALITGGTRDLPALLRLRRRGVRIVQRLDGKNWLHRARRTGLRHFLRAEYGNFNLAFIRTRLADAIVYQSKFSRAWWEAPHRSLPIPNVVIYNAVNLDEFNPSGSGERPAGSCRVLVVEGRLAGGYEIGLEMALQLASRLHQAHLGGVELIIAGQVTESLRQKVSAGASFSVTFLGEVPRQEIPALDRSAHLLFSADLNPACPNSVIEALACGLPVVAFDTGALPELVTGEAGRVVPYGGDPWRIDPPDYDTLARAALEILADPEPFRRAARQRAVETFSLERMTDSYLNFLLGYGSWSALG